VLLAIFFVAMRFASVASVCFVVSAEFEERQYAKGFVRQHRNEVFPVATITQEMRDGAPDALDWSTQGAITAVKDQGRCGSCWAFSATEGVESAVFMATGQLPPPLATQQIISCDMKEADGGGCDGGDLPGAFAYVMEAGGMDSDEDYPDTSHSFGATGTCEWSENKVAQVTSWQYAVPPCAESEQAYGGACSNQDEDGLKAALAKFGPLSVCVNAEQWSYYSSGIFTRACSGSWDALDHCVQLVGYDSTGSEPYWKVRNSWGTGWGEGGFIRLPMGVNACGIADEATYVEASLVSVSV